MKTVSRVHKHQIFAMSLRNPFVHRMIDTLVGLGHPITQSGSTLFNHLFTAIRRATVNNNVFVISKRLVKHTLNRLLQTNFIIIIYRYNGKFIHSLSNQKNEAQCQPPFQPCPTPSVLPSMAYCGDGTYCIPSYSSTFF